MKKTKKEITKPGRRANGAGREYPFDVHWYADSDTFELMMRSIFEMKGNMNRSEAHRYIWNLGADLATLRKKHRKAGIDDAKFLPESVKGK